MKDKENLLIPSYPESNQTFWGEFVLFLVVGFGLFTLLSYLIGLNAVNQNGTLKGWAIGAIAAANFVTLAGTFFLLGILRGRVTWADVGLRPLRWKWVWLVTGTLVSLFFMPIRAAIGFAAQYLLEGNLDSIMARSDLIMSGGFSLSGFLMTLIGVGILAPISEELFFRGLLHSWTQKWLKPFWGRALLTSTLFALAHFDSLGVVFSSFVMGVVIAWFYERTQSILMPIVIHASTNSIAVLLLYFVLWAQESGLVPVQ